MDTWNKLKETLKLDTIEKQNEFLVKLVFGTKGFYSTIGVLDEVCNLQKDNSYLYKELQELKEKYNG